MSIFASRLGLAIVLAALLPGGRTAHAQAAPVPYWTPSWPIGFGGAVSPDSNTDGNFSSFDGSEARAGGLSYSRYNFPNGWFIGSESRSMGLSLNGINPAGMFGNIRSEGMQFGYNFQNAPLAVYGGFNTLKYNSSIGGPFAPFDSTSGTLPGYSAHAGVEFQPAPNVSLSLGVGVTQLPGRLDGDINSLAANPFAMTGRR